MEKIGGMGDSPARFGRGLTYGTEEMKGDTWQNVDQYKQVKFKELFGNKSKLRPSSYNYKSLHIIIWDLAVQRMTGYIRYSMRGMTNQL